MQNGEYGHLSRQLKEVFDRFVARDAASGGYDSGVKSDLSTIGFLIPEINRLERIVSALESIGVNLDEEDIQALEGIAAIRGSGPLHDYTLGTIAEHLNNAIGDWQEATREEEQENAVEALVAAGFVLDDEDGETWTKDGVTVKIECVHPAESRYKWECLHDTNNPIGTGVSSGVSGEFHRLLALIDAEVKS